MVRVEGYTAVHLLTTTGFIQRTEAANWLNVAALVATMFCLLSFFILPVKWTHRHYLSICLAVGVGFMEVRSIERGIIAAYADLQSLHSSCLWGQSLSSASIPSRQMICDQVPRAPLAEPFSCSEAGLRSCGFSGELSRYICRYAGKSFPGRPFSILPLLLAGVFQQ